MAKNFHFGGKGRQGRNEGEVEIGDWSGRVIGMGKVGGRGQWIGYI